MFLLFFLQLENKLCVFPASFRPQANTSPGDIGMDPPQIATVLIHTFSVSLDPTESHIKNLPQKIWWNTLFGG